MPIWTSPSGEKFKFPDDPTAEELAFAKAYGLRPAPSPLKDALKAGGSGLLEGIARAPLIGGDIAKLAATGVNKILPGTIPEEYVNRLGSQGWIDAFKGSPQDKALQRVGVEAAYEPQTTAGRYTKAATSAVGGAASMGGIGAIPNLALRAGRVVSPANYKALAQVANATAPAPMAINAASGLAGELGYDVSRGFDETKQGNPLVALAAGVGTAGAGTFVRNRLRPNIDQQIYNATRDMKPGDWQKAAQGLDDFAAAGSKTYTLADLPELSTRLGGAAKDLSNSTGGNLLQQKLGVDRRFNEDIPQILNSARTDIMPFAVDARDVGTRLNSSGKRVIDDLVGQRSAALENDLLSAPNVDYKDLLQAAVRIRQVAISKGMQDPGMQQALREAENVLAGSADMPMIQASKLDQYPQRIPSTDVLSLSQGVKGLEDMSATSSNAAKAVSNHQARLASQLADQELKRVSPGYETAMQNYGAFNDNFLNPVKNGFPGAMAEVGGSAGAITGALRNTPRQDLLGGLQTINADTQLRRELARMLADQVQPIPNLTRASPAQMADRGNLATILTDVDPALAAPVLNKIKAADRLSMLGAEQGADSTMRSSLSQNLLSDLASPFGSAGMRARLRTSEKETARFSELLGNPTPENLTKLQELSKVDPRAAKILQWVSSLVGASVN